MDIAPEKSPKTKKCTPTIIPETRVFEKDLKQ